MIHRNPDQFPRTRRLGRIALLSVLWIIAGGAVLWAFGALHFDFPFWKTFVAFVFPAAVMVAIVRVRGVWKKLAAAASAYVLVLV